MSVFSTIKNLASHMYQHSAVIFILQNNKDNLVYYYDRGCTC